MAKLVCNSKNCKQQAPKHTQSFLMVTVGVVALLGAARTRGVDHGREAHGEVVGMVAHMVDLGMELEKWIQPPDGG